MQGFPGIHPETSWRERAFLNNLPIEERKRFHCRSFDHKKKVKCIIHSASDFPRTRAYHFLPFWLYDLDRMNSILSIWKVNKTAELEADGNEKSRLVISYEWDCNKLINKRKATGCFFSCKNRWTIFIYYYLPRMTNWIEIACVIAIMNVIGRVQKNSLYNRTTNYFFYRMKLNCMNLVRWIMQCRTEVAGDEICSRIYNRHSSGSNAVHLQRHITGCNYSVPRNSPSRYSAFSPNLKRKGGFLESISSGICERNPCKLHYV